MVPTTVEVVSDREVLISRTFDAPRRLVWRVMTEPEFIQRWYGMKIFTVPVCEVDLRVGGRWRFVLRAPDGVEHGYSGVYREVSAPERAVYTENYELLGPGHEMLHVADFTEQFGKTILVTRLTYQTQEDRDAHLQAGMEVGMRESTERLGEVLAQLVREGNHE